MSVYFFHCTTIHTRKHLRLRHKVTTIKMFIVVYSKCWVLFLAVFAHEQCQEDQSKTLADVTLSHTWDTAGNNPIHVWSVLTKIYPVWFRLGCCLGIEGSAYDSHFLSVCSSNMYMNTLDYDYALSSWQSSCFQHLHCLQVLSQEASGLLWIYSMVLLVQVVYTVILKLYSYIQKRR